MAHLLSMTGFGRGAASSDLGQASVEIKAVNHRSLKSSYRFPTGWASLEPVLRPIVESGLERGSLEVFVQIAPVSTLPASLPVDNLLDRARLSAYIEAARHAAAAAGLAAPDSITPFLAMPGVIREIALEPDIAAWQPLVLEAGRQAQTALTAQRRKEGAALATFFKSVLRSMSAALKKIAARAPDRLNEYLEQYRKRIQLLLAQHAPNASLNREVIERETVLAADRLTIDEEITRLNHHIQHFGKEIATGGPTGKSLEFIAQEMLREANTIGSKSSDSALTDLVVQMKSEIEKLKEQAANIE